ncbi:MAG: serine hydrolase [Blastocatellia bacterium]|nr:serine hydrolase [Blastocatellia bacterium]
MKMTARIMAFSLLLLLLPARPISGAFPGEGRLAEARAEMEARILESKAEVVGVAIADLETGQTLLLNERVRVHAASTMKLPVMMELFRQAKMEKLGLRQPLEVKNSFRSIIDGSEYRLNSRDDSDAEVYRWIGRRMPMIDLIDRMITRSSNLATNLLIEIAEPARVNRMMRDLGANEMEVLRGVEDAKAFQAGKNNTTTAYDLLLLLRALAEERFLDKSSCRAMIRILAAQKFNEGIPAGLPAGTKVAHKTGEITRHNHDAAIVYLPGRKPYVIVVLTKGIEDRGRSSRLIAEISRAAHRRLAR